MDCGKKSWEFLLKSVTELPWNTQLKQLNKLTEYIKVTACWDVTPCTLVDRHIVTHSRHSVPFLWVTLQHCQRVGDTAPNDSMMMNWKEFGKDWSWHKIPSENLPGGMGGTNEPVHWSRFEPNTSKIQVQCYTARPTYPVTDSQIWAVMPCQKFPMVLETCTASVFIIKKQAEQAHTKLCVCQFLLISYQTLKYKYGRG